MTRDATYFDTIADDFAARINPFDLRAREGWFRAQLARLPLHGEPVLDVGAGLGYFSRLVTELGGRPVPLDVGGRLLAKLAGEFPHAVQGDALRLPFRDGTFRVVVSSECVEHTPDPAAAIRDMLRVLRPGGVLVLSTPNRTWRWSVGLAEAIGARRFHGVENWLGRREVGEVLVSAGAEIVAADGLHLVPFQLRALWPLLAVLNRHAQALRALMINQCWVARKP